MSTDPLNLHHPGLLPVDDAQRRALHNEVHARPPERFELPAVLTYVTVLHDGVSPHDEHAHLKRLPLMDVPAALATQPGNFLRLVLPVGQLRYERHSEFTRYTLVQPGPDALAQQPGLAALPAPMVLPEGWLQGIPGRCMVAIELLLLTQELTDPQAVLARHRLWFDDGPLVASLMGGGHSCAITDFKIRDDGFERIVVLAPPATSASRAGRISQRLLELETYRLMALRGLPAAKSLSAMLANAEGELADITAHMEGSGTSDHDLLDTLITSAARVERATAEHGYRFAATQAYDSLVRQRIAELREKAIQGTPTIGDFMQRRLSPAMATVSATSARLASLSQRIERAGALLRTRVDIATEEQNQQLLAKLTRGQALQLRLQSTVEGLSIAAISYYVVSLLLYGAKAARAAGVAINPELAAGLFIPLVLWAVWRATRQVHRRLMGGAIVGGQGDSVDGGSATSKTR